MENGMEIPPKVKNTMIMQFNSLEFSWIKLNIQDWFPLGLTGLISLQSKGFSRVFSNIQKHQSKKLKSIKSKAEEATFFTILEDAALRQEEGVPLARIESHPLETSVSHMCRRGNGGVERAALHTLFKSLEKEILVVLSLS